MIHTNVSMSLDVIRTKGYRRLAVYSLESQPCQKRNEIQTVKSGLTNNATNNSRAELSDHWPRIPAQMIEHLVLNIRDRAASAQI